MSLGDREIALVVFSCLTIILIVIGVYVAVKKLLRKLLIAEAEKIAQNTRDTQNQSTNISNIERLHPGLDTIPNVIETVPVKPIIPKVPKVKVEPQKKRKFLYQNWKQNNLSYIDWKINNTAYEEWKNKSNSKTLETNQTSMFSIQDPGNNVAQSSTITPYEVWRVKNNSKPTMQNSVLQHGNGVSGRNRNYNESQLHIEEYTQQPAYNPDYYGF